jgi:hypothetical protein
LTPSLVAHVKQGYNAAMESAIITSLLDLTNLDDSSGFFRV